MPLSLGVGFIVATVLVVLTAGTVAAGLPFVIAGAALLGKGISELLEQRHALPAPVSKERELLLAIRDNGGSITPAERPHWRPRLRCARQIKCSRSWLQAAILQWRATKGHCSTRSPAGALRRSRASPAHRVSPLAINLRSSTDRAVTELESIAH